MARSERWEGSEVAIWEKWDSEVAGWERLESSKVARWEVPGFNLRVEGRRVGPRFHLFVSDVNQRNKGAGCCQDAGCFSQILDREESISPASFFT